VTPLNTAEENTRLVAQMIEFSPGDRPAPRRCFARPAGVVYVLEGRLQLDAGGMQEVLEAGDCAFIESEMALAWSAADKHRCRILGRDCRKTRTGLSTDSTRRQPFFQVSKRANPQAPRPSIRSASARAAARLCRILLVLPHDQSVGWFGISKRTEIMRPNVNLMKATLTGALGGLLFGFDTVVIAGAIDALVRSTA
jgi:hypothetical protein